MFLDRRTGSADGPEDPFGSEHSLHDSVIQRLYAAELQLQSALVRVSDSATRQRIRQSIHLLDEVIGDVRSALRHGRS